MQAHAWGKKRQQQQLQLQQQQTIKPIWILVLASPSHLLLSLFEILQLLYYETISVQVLCVSISTELDLAASGAKDGTCLLHTIRQGNYIHTLRPREGLKCEIHQAAISNTGRLVIYSEDTTHRQRVRETLFL